MTEQGKFVKSGVCIRYGQPCTNFKRLQLHKCNNYINVHQCSNYHTSRVGRGPPTSLNGPPTLRKSRGPKGAAFGPLTCADPGGSIRPWKRSMTKKKKKKAAKNFGKKKKTFWGKNAKRFSETPVKSGKKISEKICPPTLTFWIRIASLALTIVWAPLLIFW